MDSTTENEKPKRIGETIAHAKSNLNMNTKEENEDHAPAAACSELHAADQSVEIIVESSGLSGVLHSDFTINKDELKARTSFRRLLELDGHKMKKSGNTYKCLCPFHHEGTPSFHVYDDATGKCYGCNWYGDIYDYEMEAKEIGFYDALKNLNAVAANVQRTSPLRKKAQTRLKLESLTGEQLATMSEAAKQLASSEWLLSRVADARGWQIETIQKLADEGSLGWYKGALAFLYQTGMKLRNWPYKQPIVWEFGNGESIWRQHSIKDARTIYLCEGEIDAITLLDNWLENSVDGVSVVALPSASTLPQDLLHLLTGKHVRLFMDNDEAGWNATETLYNLLAPVAASVLEYSFDQEVGHE